EYLSKPLKQNQLIQTILKCATLGGALLERGREMRASATDDSLAGLSSGSGSKCLVRPTLDARAATTTGPITHGSSESPVLVATDPPDPVER
ncbi:hypothetical protein GP486_008476, partial [Trichoglossum hirsutum]